MKNIIIMFMIGIAFGIWKYWYQPSNSIEAISKESGSSAGFIHVGKMKSIPKNRVVIIGASCNQKLHDLSKRLNAKKIPNEMRDSFELDMTPYDEGFKESSKRIKLVAEGGTPIVVINEMAKSNATEEETTNEYYRQLYLKH